MGDTTILVTLALLLDFFKSKLQHTHPGKYSEKLFIHKELQKHNRNKELEQFVEYARKEVPAAWLAFMKILSLENRIKYL